MKIFSLLLLPSMFFLVGARAQVVCAPTQTLYVDSSYQGRANGTAAAPFSTIAAATAVAKARNYCEINLFVKKGTYPETIAFDRAATVKGDGRTLSIVTGGFWSFNNADLTLWDLGFNNVTGRAILKVGGTVHFNRITVDSYHFVKQMMITSPAAVDLTNVTGNVTGLDFFNSSQPNFLLSGASTNLSILGLSTTNSHYVPGYDTPQLNYIAAVELSGGAKVNLVGAKMMNAEGIALLTSGAVAKMTYVEADHTDKGATQYGSNIVFKSSQVQGSGFTSTGAEAAGIILIDSTFLDNASTFNSNKYGVVLENTNVPKDYQVGACFTARAGVTVGPNSIQNIISPGDLPIPNQPLPVPCAPGQVCPTPTPTPTPIPVNCYPVTL